MVAPFVLAHTDRLPFSRSVSLSVYNFSQACSRPILARMYPHLDDTLLISPTIFCRIRGADFVSLRASLTGFRARGVEERGF